MSKLPKLTSAQAEAAERRAGDSMALTSGAGCGKTLVLARRFTTLLLRAGAGEDESPFEKFVALTFTDKAALEMIARVRGVLTDALAGSRSADDRARLADWIAELPAAHISTIHSFCASLLRRYAVEAGVDPGFAVQADDLLAAQMRSEAAERAILAAVEAGDEATSDLLVRGSADGLTQDIRTLLDRRIAWARTDFSDIEATLARWREQRKQVRARLLRRLGEDDRLHRELAELSAVACSDPTDMLLVYRQEKLAVIARILDDPTSAGVEEFGALTETPGRRGGAKAWSGANARTAYRRRLKAFVESFGKLAPWFDDFDDADEDAARCLATLGRLVRSADELYTAAKRRRGMLDFDDLIIRTSEVLESNPSVRLALRDRLDQLLIDECQDTDTYQLEMLWRMLSDDDTPPPGKLFVVGDLKQSIYRFRGAQAEAFNELCGRFGSDRIGLDESFRMHKPGAAFVNHLFAEMMGADYEPIRAARTETPAGESVEILLAEMGDGANAQAATLAQADLVAQRIEQMVGREKLVYDAEAEQWREVGYGDVAILFARMTKSLAYEHALQQRDIPYHVVAGVGFLQQQEVSDILNALRVIDNPLDDVALIGVLRSAIFGLDDNSLLRIATAVAPPYFDKLAGDEVLAALAEPWREQLAFATGLLARLHREKDALGAAGVIERLLAETGYAATLLSQFHGRQKFGNVQRLLEAARSAQAAGAMSIADFVKRFNELIVAESRYEQAPVAGEDDNAVRIMTIHKAKGLEFPVVIAPDLNANFGGVKGRLLFRHDMGVVYDPPTVQDDDAKPLIWRLAKEAEEREMRAEDVRKLYVAATRHQDHLIFVGADWPDKTGRLRGSSSHLRRLDEVLGVGAALDAGAERIEYGDGFSARLAKVAPSGAARRVGRRPIGQKLAAEAADPAELAAALASSAKKPAKLELVGPLAAQALTRIAPTALADFEHCPKLFHWRHELRAPGGLPAGGDGGPSAGPDAATAGTFFHRCMELIDFQTLASDSRALAGPLARRVAGEMELASGADVLTADLAEMLDRLARTPLAGEIASARRRLPELSFTLRSGGLDISGQIDLLYEDASGAWHVVDYKSDRLAAGDVASHAGRYELQMMLYLAAGRRLLGADVEEATLYFLRNGETHSFAGAAGDLEASLAELAESLSRCRRSGDYARREDESCRGCPYERLCLR